MARRRPPHQHLAQRKGGGVCPSLCFHFGNMPTVAEVGDTAGTRRVARPTSGNAGANSGYQFGV